MPLQFTIPIDQAIVQSVINDPTIAQQITDAINAVNTTALSTTLLDYDTLSAEQARNTQLATDLATINSNLNTETSNRTTADTNLQNQITSDVSNLSANYYNKTSTDTLLNGKSNTAHIHTVADITNLQNTIDTINTNISNETTARTNADNATNTNLSTNYYSSTAVDTLLSAKSSTGHTHTYANITDFDSGIATYINNNNNSANNALKLDGNGFIPQNLIPDSLTEYKEYADVTALQTSGDEQPNRIYVVLDTGKLYRWSGSVYVELALNDVNSVNGYQGIIVLDTDDFAEGNNKFVSATEKTNLQNLPTDLTNINSSITTINTNITNLQNQDITHTNAIATKSDVGHTHTISNITNLQTTLDGKEPAISKIGNANKFLKFNGTEDGFSAVDAPSGLPPYTISDAQKVLAVNITGDDTEWVAPNAGQQQQEYLPTEWIRVPTNNEGYSKTGDASGQIIENGFTNEYYKSVWYDNNTNSNFFSTNNSSQTYFSVKTATDRLWTDQGFVIYLIEDGLETDFSNYNNTNAGRVMVLTSGGTLSSILFDGDLNVGGSGVQSTASSTGNGTFDTYINTLTDGQYRIPVNISFSVAIDNTTKLIHSFWHDENGNLLKTFSTDFTGDTIDNKGILRIAIKMEHQTTDTSAGLTQKLTILSASQAPTTGLEAFTYLYDSGTAGGFTLPINISDVLSLQATLNSKITSPSASNGQFLKYNGSTWIADTAPTGANELPDPTTNNNKIPISNGTIWTATDFPNVNPYNIPNPSGLTNGHTLQISNDNYVVSAPSAPDLTSYALKTYVDTQDANLTTSLVAVINGLSTTNSNVATNTSNIATNTSNIATNTSNISALTSNLSTNYYTSAQTTSIFQAKNSTYALNDNDITQARYLQFNATNGIRSANSTNNITVNDTNTTLHKSVDANNNSIVNGNDIKCHNLYYRTGDNAIPTEKIHNVVNNGNFGTSQPVVAGKVAFKSLLVSSVSSDVNGVADDTIAANNIFGNTVGTGNVTLGNNILEVGTGTLETGTKAIITPSQIWCDTFSGQSMSTFNLSANNFNGTSVLMNRFNQWNNVGVYKRTLIATGTFTLSQSAPIPLPDGKKFYECDYTCYVFLDTSSEPIPNTGSRWICALPTSDNNASNIFSVYSDPVNNQEATNLVWYRRLTRFDGAPYRLYASYYA